jgi:hypothetical protein
MNEWKYINSTEISHESAFRLELLAGTWIAPAELNSIIVKGLSPVTTAGLIREGLSFAKRQNIPRSTIRAGTSSPLVD